MRPFEQAWNILKEDDMEKHKATIVKTLKKEGGAAGVDLLCKATGLSKSACKKLIASMDNVKMHKHGDAILMDGL